MPDRLNILIFFSHFSFRDFGAKIISHDSFTNIQNIKSSYSLSLSLHIYV